MFLLSYSPRTHSGGIWKLGSEARSTYYSLAYNLQQNNLCFVLCFAHLKKYFVTLYTILMVLGTPTRCCISDRFRGSPSLTTSHLLLISNYARASPFWKSTGSYRFPNIAYGFCWESNNVRGSINAITLAVICHCNVVGGPVGSCRTIDNPRRYLPNLSIQPPSPSLERPKMYHAPLDRRIPMRPGNVCILMFALLALHVGGLAFITLIRNSNVRVLL